MRLVFDPSSLTRWRQRMGEDKFKALLQESLAVASRTDAMKPSDLARVVIDTTVQPKAVMFPTDAKLLNRARERWPEPAPILCAGRQAGSDQASALRPCPSVQARQPQLAQASRPISAVSSATSSGPSSGMKICGKRSYGSCSWPGACWSRSAASAAARSIPCTRQRYECVGKGKARRPRAICHPCCSTVPQSL